MMQMLPNIPGQPHRWADSIGAWARGELVQWRYRGDDATDADWRDCDYPSRGMPNWHNDLIEFRVAPHGVLVPDHKTKGG